MTAIRETFEETGILLASSTSPNPPPSPNQLSIARRAIHSRTDPTTFPSFLAENNLSIGTSTEHLIPFTQWVTPVTAKSRFWTWFYVGFLDEMEGVLVADDVRTEYADDESVLRRVAVTAAPTHDDHIEIQSTYFQSPRSIIQAFDRGDITLMPPQYYLLTMLANGLDHHRDGTKRRNGRPAAQYLRALVSRGFGGRVFNPRFGGNLVGEDGIERTVLMYEGDAQYGEDLGSEGLADLKMDGKGEQERVRHRSLLTFVDGVCVPVRYPRDLPCQYRRLCLLSKCMADVFYRSYTTPYTTFSRH